MNQRTKCRISVTNQLARRTTYRSFFSNCRPRVPRQHFFGGAVGSGASRVDRLPGSELAATGGVRFAAQALLADLLLLALTLTLSPRRRVRQQQHVTQHVALVVVQHRCGNAPDRVRDWCGRGRGRPRGPQGQQADRRATRQGQAGKEKRENHRQYTNSNDGNHRTDQYNMFILLQK